MKDEISLDDSDLESSHLLSIENKGRPARLHATRLVWVLTALLAAAAATITYLSIQVHTRSKPSTFLEHDFGDCGSTAVEARANGCKFDVTVWAWERPACYDQALIDDFLNRTDWHFYGHPGFDAADELPLDRVAAGDYETVYVDSKYHRYHCTYMWQKMHRHVWGRFELDHVNIPMDHTLHCERILLGEDRREMQCDVFPFCTTKLDFIYAKCGHT